ncbi:L10-interacting MYB domain-containing protein-like [Camellia sinensis]|uniref:L10-interacting MYB domain-containing protein-like n=1 Tax=Camellia sinensis TaxID=4442 RepID=UPI0010355966|nr:L10-interacting MYB domain-containing protein-like [Camellia sinensis]
MDCYFIDLMLEEVGKGNQIDDHLFNKQAWMHMTSLINAKFKFQYEKDVLKNRHKTLRNLYKAVKNLIDQKGFNWDETRQMVTADNKVWDDYMKVHPNSRSYRIKTIPYYKDFCVIYKNTTVGGKTNMPLSETGRVLEGLESLATTVDDGELGDNLLELSSNSGVNTKTLSSTVDDEASKSATRQPEADTDSRIGTCSRTYWQPPMDRYFIDLMLEQVQKGNQIDDLFHKQTWTKMIASFNARFGFKYDIDVLKNRYKTLKRQYNVIKNLLNLNRFFWDETRQMVTADDRVWQDYIIAHEDARQYMTRPVPYYKDLCGICRELGSDGRDSVSDHNLDQQDNIPEVKFARPLNNFQYPVESVSSEEVKIKLGMSSALREMETAVSCLADKKKDDEDSCSISVENVIEAIQALPDMDEDFILDACDLL